MTEGRTNSLKCFLKENIFKFLVFSCMSSVYNSEESFKFLKEATMNLHNKAVQLLIAVSIVALSIAAKICHQLDGEKASYQSRTQRMTLLDCFDMGYGTLACVIKEAVIIYLNYARAVYVNKVRYEATRAAMMGQAQDQRAEDRLKRAREEGNAAARQASVEAQHILGPIISSWWDFFVTLYAGGTLAEGVISFLNFTKTN